MSSAVVSTSAALGRPFVFDDETVPEVSSPASLHREGQAETQESPITRILQSTISNQKSTIALAYSFITASIVEYSWLLSLTST